MSVDIDLLTHAYFYYDEPVPYTLKNAGEIQIRPILLKESEIFFYSFGILNIDKNSTPDVEIIQMSYLQYICQVLLKDKNLGDFNKQCLYNILSLCLNMKAPVIQWKNNKTPIVYDKEQNVGITAKEFDEIRKIILHQNFPHFDDEYINPELKKAMDEVDQLKNQDKESPSIERKMAIITAHTGLPKREQIDMTLRSHSLLFEEVVGEVEFDTVRPPLIARGLAKEIDHWIFKKKKGKFDGYTKSVDSYTKSMGGSNNIRTSSAETGVGNSYIQQFNSFTQK